jgi:predicted ATP-grasp superfamily ATP-dependent carboligase
MRVLLTSPRAPVTLDLARRFSSSGHEVFVCDPLRFGCGTHSRHVRQAFHVPRPSDSGELYVAALQRIVEKYRIDYLVPTCEEIFYIAKHRPQVECQVFVDDFDKLHRLHNKWKFSQQGSNTAASVPETRLLQSQSDVQQLADQAQHFVFKPVYSRFASESLIRPKPDQLKRVNATSQRSWVAQRFIAGTEYSTYSVAKGGVLLAHACYTSSYRAGRGSGIYFHARSQPQILAYVRQFAEENDFTGQVGFDCIVDEQGVAWIIECNPRATSGLHLFEDDLPLIELILGTQDRFIEATSSQPQMLCAAMPFWGLTQALQRMRPMDFLRDVWRGRDVLFRWTDPLPLLCLPLTMAELGSIAILERRTLQQAATRDIEWNGDPL